MRISLLEKREDFYKILPQTLENSEFFEKTSSRQKKKYLVNKYLNFISQKNLGSKAFANLKNEYSNSMIWWKRHIQRLYVSLAIAKPFRGLFAHKVLEMPDYGPYLVLGGNHRLRLFTEEASSTWSILKTGERRSYIVNDIKVRTDFKLSYVPQVLNSGNGWLEEEFFEAVPLNRLQELDRMKNIELEIAKTHHKELLKKSEQIISKEDYISLVQKEIEMIIDNDKIHSDSSILENITLTLDKLLQRISKDKIPLSWTHGDFQMANILVKGNQVKVIDWESSAKRFGLYDWFVLFGKTRSEIELMSSISAFQAQAQLLDIYITEHEIILCLVEELRFHISEDFSENFFFCGERTNHLCSQILQYINA